MVKNEFFLNTTFAGAAAGAKALEKAAMDLEAQCLAEVIDLDPNESDGLVLIALQEIWNRVGDYNIDFFQKALEEIGFSYKASDPENVEIAVNKTVLNFVDDVMADGDMSPEEIEGRYGPAIEALKRARGIHKKNSSAVELKVMAFVIGMKEPAVSMSQAGLYARFGKDDAAMAIDIIRKLGLSCKQRRRNKGNALGKTGDDDVVWVIGNPDDFDAWASAQEEAAIRSQNIMKPAEE